MSASGKNSIWTEIIKGVFALLGVLVTGYITLIATGVVDFPFAKSRIESKLVLSMTELKTGLEELDAALDVEGKTIDEGLVYCRKTHPANVLHGYETILQAKTYDIAKEPVYIRDAYAQYQQALQTVNSQSMQKLYKSCLVFDRTGNNDPDITEEEFGQAALDAQSEITHALEILNGAVEKIP